MHYLCEYDDTCICNFLDWLLYIIKIFERIQITDHKLKIENTFFY